jgi:RNA 2',3'-cyclic 3'-phosphodiesterase
MEKTDRPVRAFLGISIPEELSHALIDVVQPLRERYPNLRWVPRENIHVTLAFLGIAPLDELRALASQLRRTVSVTPFEMHLEGMGTFPKRGRVRVVWSGLNGEVQALRNLHTYCAESLRHAGFPLDNACPYHPHVTLARVSRASPANLRRAISTFAPWRSDAFKVSSVSLFESTLCAEGSKYTAIETIQLPCSTNFSTPDSPTAS